MLTSSGAVAFTVVTLLPVELILQVGSGAGYAMIFALLIAAIIWNLGTWALGLPNSSSHALVGSIMGVGIANQLISPNGSATSGVDWAQAVGVLKALLFSPLIGFVLAALLLLLMKFVVRSKALYAAPEGKKPPPLPIRGAFGADLHRRLVFPRQQRRPEGHGPDHADPDRRHADGVCAEPRHSRRYDARYFCRRCRPRRMCFRRMPGRPSPPADAAAARATVGDALKSRA